MPRDHASRSPRREDTDSRRRRDSSRRNDGRGDRDERRYTERSDRERDTKRRRRTRSRSRNGDDRRESDKLSRRKKRERSETSEESTLDLRALGVREISEDDFYLRSSEYKLWLKEERGRYLHEMSSESARKYFRKFVRRWNDGALRERYYRPQPESSRSAIELHYPDLNGRRGEQDLSEDDEAIGPLPPAPASHSRALGPAVPSASDRQLAIEEEKETRKAERKAHHRDEYRKADEAVPRNVGKEGKMEEKRANNAVNKELREKEVGGLELDEGTLMGDAGGFAAALRARDGAKNRREEQRATEAAARRAADQERLTERRHKESATMDMFKAMARERFG